MVRFALPIAAILSLGGQSALGQGISLANENGEFNETTYEKSKVSGDIVLGVMWNDDAPRPTVPDVWGHVPDDMRAGGDGSLVCVRIVSKDGLYEAENTYSIDAGFDADLALFPYGGTRAERVGEARAVARVTHGHCGDRTRRILPAVFRQDPEVSGDAKLKVFLNTAGNPTWVFKGDGSDFLEECRDATETDGLKYTTVCEIPEAKLELAGDTEITFLVVRNQGEERFPVFIAAPLSSGQ